MKKIILVFIFLALMAMVGVFAYNNRLTISFILKNYQEECLEHSWYNYTYCPCELSNWSIDGNTNLQCNCFKQLFINYPNASSLESNYVYSINNSMLAGWYSWKTISLPNASDCIAYHLVRRSLR